MFRVNTSLYVQSKHQSLCSEFTLNIKTIVYSEHKDSVYSEHIKTGVYSEHKLVFMFRVNTSLYVQSKHPFLCSE
jgi:hypothetical protein